MARQNTGFNLGGVIVGAGLFLGASHHAWSELREAETMRGRDGAVEAVFHAIGDVPHTLSLFTDPEDYRPLSPLDQTLMVYEPSFVIAGLSLAAAAVSFTALRK